VPQEGKQDICPSSKILLGWGIQIGKKKKEKKNTPHINNTN
jgi:hypothetical protein